MSKNTVWVVSGGTSYYLSGSNSAANLYTGSGTPWTVEATSPYELSDNDTTGAVWVPQPAPTNVVYSGGPPFTNGRRPAYRSFDNVTETVGIQLRATTKDNAIFLLRQLRQILNTATYSTPPILAVQSGTNTGSTEIYSADVPENPRYIDEEGIWRATITWTRHPHFGSSGLTTLINAVSIGNVGTGAPDNIESLGALTGDLIYDGQPLNIKIVPGFNTNEVWLATVLARDFVETNETETGYTGTFQAGTFGSTTISAASTTTIATIRSNAAIKMRVLARIATITNPSKVRMRVTAKLASGAVFYTGPIVSAPGSNTTGQLVDCGVVPLDIFRSSVIRGTDILRIDFNYASSDGTAVTFTYDYVELLFYYDFCKIGPSTVVTESFELLEAQTLNGSVYRPLVPARAYGVDGTTLEMKRPFIPIGTPVRAFSGASLWIATMSSNNAHTRADTSTITVEHLPLYLTVRGGA